MREEVKCITTDRHRLLSLPDANPVWLQLQQYKVSGHPPKAIEDRPKENGQADEGQQQNKVSKTNCQFLF